MNPQDYTTPPDPNSTTDPSVKSWFDSIPSASLPTTEEPGPSSHKKWILIVAVVGVLLIGGAMVILWPTKAPVTSVGTCLTNDHYKSLTGVTLEEKLSSKDGFYTHSFDFVPTSSDYLRGTETASENFIQKVASVYKKHSETSSVILTVSGDYDQSHDTEVSAKERIKKIEDALVQYGVPKTAMKTVAPTAYSSEGELDEDSEELKVAKVYLTITSDSKCDQ